MKKKQKWLLTTRIVHEEFYEIITDIETPEEVEKMFLKGDNPKDFQHVGDNIDEDSYTIEIEPLDS